MFQLQLAAAALNCKGGNPVCASMMYSSAQKSMDSGYPLDWFVESVNEKFICEICGKVVQSPRATPCCSSVFCLHCLEFWIEYYGICPKRCGEIDADSLKKETDIEKSIQSLPVRCKNGCKAKLVLEEKLKHEKKCQHKLQLTAADDQDPERKTSMQSQDAYVEMASVACRNKTAAATNGGTNETDGGSRTSPVVSRTASSSNNLHPIFTRDLAYYTYNLTRRTPGESLGFVLVAGAKNSNGKAVNFSIKTVNPNTVAAEVGLLPGDRIVQVDNIPLSQLAQPDAISKIKDNPQVTLTIIRNNPKKQSSPKSSHRAQHRRSIENHVYEDIPSTEEQQLILQQEKFRERLGGSVEDELKKNFDPRARHLSPPVSYQHHPAMDKAGNRLLMEKMSKDSGLSSGSSSTPGPSAHQFNRHMMNNGVEEAADIGNGVHHHGSHSKHSYKVEREAMKKNMHERDILEMDQSPSHHPSAALRQDYEIEEIFLQKNGTNQLGITLGYDTKSSGGNLIVCEIVSEGLAAQDGRLHKGDIIQKVNGFEVYDPEEAILLFLEQDQDITLTVARKVKASKRRRHMLSSKSQTSLDSSSNNMMAEGRIRRTDSCGSLDSMTHRDVVHPEVERKPQSRRHSDSSKRIHKTSMDGGSPSRMFHAPTISSSGYMTGPDATSTDFMFRPINDSRPMTAGDVTRPSHTRYLRSTTSLGSDPAERSMMNNIHHFHHQNTAVSRHRSFEGTDHRRLLKSPISPQQSSIGPGYRIPSPLKNSSRSVFSDNSSRMTDQVMPIDRVMMQRSVSTFRCESLV